MDIFLGIGFFIIAFVTILGYIQWRKSRKKANGSRKLRITDYPTLFYIITFFLMALFASVFFFMRYFYSYP
jgi:uncharacterized membrane protein YadS